MNDNVKSSWAAVGHADRRVRVRIHGRSFQTRTDWYSQRNDLRWPVRALKRDVAATKRAFICFDVRVSGVYYFLGSVHDFKNEKSKKKNETKPVYRATFFFKSDAT